MEMRAVLVGIGTYGDGQALTGPPNDVIAMRTMLLAEGWTNADIHVLLDASATKASILRELRWMTHGLASGDRAVFHFSGHGMPLGVGGNIYSVLLPYDFQEQPADVLSYEDFKQPDIFGSIADGVLVTFIADACYTGLLFPLLARLARFFRFGGHAQRYVVPRTVPVSPATAQAVRAATAQVPPVGPPASALNVAMISASDADARGNPTGELNYTGTTYGALTYYLLSVLREDGAARTESLLKLINDVSRKVQLYVPYQVPKLHGNSALFTKPFLGGLPNPVPFSGSSNPKPSPIAFAFG
jgi:Caspase domain